MSISREDYEEAACPFCKPQSKASIPVARVIEKLDAYLYKKDFPAAEAHLEYWRTEAEAVGDMRGLLTVLNETVGFYRRQGEGEKSLSFAEKATLLALSQGFAETTAAGTTLLNAATAYEAFGNSEKAVELYRQAEIIYESRLEKNDERLGGLYNNLALALMSTSAFEEAKKYFEKALAIMAQTENREPEQAITYCNLADLVYSEKGEGGSAEIGDYMKKAEDMLNGCKLMDGNYAYVCEKCAPVFEYYGNTEFGTELKERAKKFYDGN